MQRESMVVLSGLQSLRIASQDGAPGNEYRIGNSSVEFRSLDPQGKPFNHPNGQWRELDPNEIELHFALHTPVADWLNKNLYSSPKAA